MLSGNANACFNSCPEFGYIVRHFNVMGTGRYCRDMQAACLPNTTQILTDEIKIFTSHLDYSSAGCCMATLFHQTVYRR